MINDDEVKTSAKGANSAAPRATVSGGANAVSGAPGAFSGARRGIERGGVEPHGDKALQAHGGKNGISEPHSDKNGISEPHSDKALQAHGDKALQAHSDKALQAHSDKALQAHSDKALQAHSDKPPGISVVIAGSVLLCAVIAIGGFVTMLYDKTITHTPRGRS